MFQDTLVALDWDGKTAIPYLAKSWTISEDGKTYVFKLRDDVTFCSGKKFTAADVVYSFKRLKDPETKAPYHWRAGEIKEVRAPDPYTVEYELKEPYSELLLQLTMYTNAIHNQESVETLGKDYGIKGIDGTGPWCFESWQPRTEIVLKRHDAYKWGPSMYQNKGPVKFEKLSIKIVPEDASRVAAMLGGQFDLTHQIPIAFIQQVKAAPNLTVQEAQPNFQLMYYGYKITRPMVADRRVREAMNIAINRAEIVKGIMLGNAEPAYTFVDPKAMDFAEKTKSIIKEDVERAKKLLDEAGWKVGADGIREKDGMKLAPRVLFVQVAYFPRVSEAIQGYMRKIGIDWKIVGYDSTIAPAEMSKQDYELWTVTVPYLSAGELMNIYFNSKNIPTPNRMNWKDEETDAWLHAGRSALTDTERALNYARVQEKVTNEHLMMPVMNINMYTTSSKKLKGVRPHMLYQNTFYKGLDYSF
jgi:peptide/nickel transport system substrate-binding protein